MTVLWGLSDRLKLARLGFVTGTRGGGQAWEDYCRDLFLAGVDLILIKEPDLTPEATRAAIQAGLRAGFGSGRIVGLAQAELPDAGVDLIHLATRQPVATDPEEFPLVGRSAESVFEAQRRFEDPALAYVTIGPVRDGDNLSLARGLDLVTLAAGLAPVADPASKPWFAVGGISEDNLDAVLEAGARRVFVHRAIAHAVDPIKTARDWANRLRRLWRDDPELRDYSAAVRQGVGRVVSLHAPDEDRRLGRSPATPCSVAEIPAPNPTTWGDGQPAGPAPLARDGRPGQPPRGLG